MYDPLNAVRHCLLGTILRILVSVVIGISGCSFLMSLSGFGIMARLTLQNEIGNVPFYVWESVRRRIFSISLLVGVSNLLPTSLSNTQGNLLAYTCS